MLKKMPDARIIKVESMEAELEKKRPWTAPQFFLYALNNTHSGVGTAPEGSGGNTIWSNAS